MKIFTRIVFAMAVLIIAGLLMTYLLFMFAGMRASSMVDGFSPDLSRISDGTYTGEFSFLGRTQASVAFEVRDGKLISLSFDHLAETPGYGAAYTVMSHIESGPRLDFDAVTGATVTANFARAAIMDALTEVPE